MSDKTKKIAPLVFFLVFFFGLVWAAIVPPNNEAPDEAAHLQIVYFLKEHRRTPVFNQEIDLPKLVFDQRMLSGAYYSMAYNSPFSYLPFLPLVRSETEDNSKSNLLLARELNVLFVSLFALFLFLGLSSISPKKEELASAVAIFFALSPQVIFSAGYLNIEPIALLLSVISFYFLLSAQKDKDNYNLILFGISIALLALCKANYLMLVAAFGSFGIYRIFSEKNFTTKEKIYKTLYIVLPFIIFTAWWWVRNYLLYQDPLVFSYIQSLIQQEAPNWFLPPKDAGYNLITILFKPDFVKYAYLGFFAGLGGANIFLPKIFYLIFYLILFVGSFSALISSLKNRKYLFAVLFSAALLFLNLLLFGYKNLNDFSPQGRHFFPMIPVIAWLVFYGLSNIKFKILPVILFVFSIFASVYALVVLVDQYFVTGAAYTMIGNMDKTAQGFTWGILLWENYLNLVDTVFAGNSFFFSPYLVLGYFLLFLILSAVLIFIAIKDNGERE